jgi:hypothetical protein
VTRALRLFALFTAFFVVSVRCLSGFPLTMACAAVPDSGAEQLCPPPSDEPREEDTLAPIVTDDADDGADALITPPQPRIRVLTHGRTSGADRGALAADRALSSHARGLERPPRA